MSLTWADVVRWNPEAIRDVAKSLTKRGVSAQEIADGFKHLPLMGSWEGSSGTAAKASLDKLAKHLVSHADEMAALSKALLKAASEVDEVKKKLTAVYDKAHNWHFDIDTVTGAVTPTLGADMSGISVVQQAELERDVQEVLNDANAADQHLASAIADVGTSVAREGILLPTGEPAPDQPKLPFEEAVDQINAPTPPGERFSEAERYIFSEIEKNRNSEIVNDLAARMTPPVSGLDAVLAGRKWAEMVQTNGEWDHKPKIEELLGITSPNKLDPNHYFQQPGTKRSVLYDIYSNIHYGYLGRVSGIPTDTLVWGATRGTAETGQNDDGDLITMRGGAALFDKYGPNMTAEQFHTGLTDIINQLDAAKRAGQPVPQIAYLP